MLGNQQFLTVTTTIACAVSIYKHCYFDYDLFSVIVFINISVAIDQATKLVRLLLQILQLVKQQL